MMSKLRNLPYRWRLGIALGILGILSAFGLGIAIVIEEGWGVLLLTIGILGAIFAIAYAIFYWISKAPDF